MRQVDEIAHQAAAGRPGASTASTGRTSADFVQTALHGRGRLAGGRGAAAVRPARAAATSRTARTTPTSGDLRLDLPDGRGQVRLEDAGRLPPTAATRGRTRSSARTPAGGSSIRCNAPGRDLASVVADIERRCSEQVPTAGGLLRRVRRAVREPAAGDAADRASSPACRSSACSSC